MNSAIELRDELIELLADPPRRKWWQWKRPANREHIVLSRHQALMLVGLLNGTIDTTAVITQLQGRMQLMKRIESARRGELANASV